MTRFAVLPTETFQKPVKAPRVSYLPEYRNFLATLQPDQGGELELEGSEKKATIKNRLNHAARLEGIAVRYLRSGLDRVRFQVTEPLPTAEPDWETRQSTPSSQKRARKKALA